MFDMNNMAHNDCSCQSLSAAWCVRKHLFETCLQLAAFFFYVILVF